MKEYREVLLMEKTKRIYDLTISGGKAVTFIPILAVIGICTVLVGLVKCSIKAFEHLKNKFKIKKEKA